MIYPPQSWKDILHYDADEWLAGYRDQRPGDLDPGPNHSASYRWGWLNRKRDRQREDDGFDALRGRTISSGFASRRRQSGK